ncbi:MAG: hypothetical protein ACI84C_002413, partial [Flavobacteriales bacterium]
MRYSIYEGKKEKVTIDIIQYLEASGNYTKVITT